ncbi:MAG TPA: hypothetical protein VE404_01370, partial [Verrucomicrobiae bacterium]|nr:hypothetical protein [Verrucomicrobiae bacterium]
MKQASGVRSQEPVAIALIESSIGLSGSTMSLSALLRRLDRDRFEPHVIVAREEQEVYLRDVVGSGPQVARISPGWETR